MKAKTKPENVRYICFFNQSVAQWEFDVVVIKW